MPKTRPDIEGLLRMAERLLGDIPDGWMDFWPESVAALCEYALACERERDEARETAEHLHETLDNVLSGYAERDEVEMQALPWLAANPKEQDNGND